jgi:hypothetical protein
MEESLKNQGEFANVFETHHRKIKNNSSPETEEEASCPSLNASIIM